MIPSAIWKKISASKFLKDLNNRPFSLGRFVFPLQSTCYSPENYSFVCLKIIYSYAHDYLKIWKQEFSRVSSHGLYGTTNRPVARRGECNLKYLKTLRGLIYSKLHAKNIYLLICKKVNFYFLHSISTFCTVWD